MLSQSAAIGNWTIQNPLDGFRVETLQRLTNQLNRGFSLVNRAIRAMDARQISNTSIATEHQDTTAQRCFHRDDEIEPIYDKILACYLFGLDHRDGTTLFALI